MRRMYISPLPRLAWVAVLAIAGGACSASSDGNASATGGKSGGTGGTGALPGTGGTNATGGTGALPGTGGATGGTTNSGTGGDVTGAGGDVTGTGGMDSSGGAGGQGQPMGGGTGTGNAGTSGGGCGTAAFCDDFERTMLGPNWMLEPGSNTIEISTMQHHSGTSSAHIKLGTSAGATYLNATKGFPFPNDTFWGRVWLYAMNGLEMKHHVFIEEQNAATMKAVRVLNTQNDAQLATNMQLGDKTGYSTPAVQMPQGKWSCFEWNITATGGKGTVTLYLDGVDLKATLTGVAIPQIDKTRLGMQRYMGGAAGDLWYDDYAVGTTRIGCN